jgi:uncharacterized protein (DUF1778 family)
MSRLSIEIEPEQHRQIKTLATYEGMTIKEFILKQTLRSRPWEEMDTTEKLLSHPKNRKRLLEAINAPDDENIVFETMDELRDALGIQRKSA